MTEMLQYIQVANQTFWGKDVYHVWFYAAVLVIIIFERCSITKKVVGIYPVCFILALYSPVAYQLIQTYTSGIWQYFARLYSMIPLPITLGLGTILLVEAISSKTTKNTTDHETFQNESVCYNRKNAVIKLILTGGFCGVMLLGGTNVYQQDWMKPAQNLNKVPAESKAICQILHKDEGVTIAVPDSLSSYIRQIDPSFYMPYGRYVNELGAALSQEHPDPEYVMSEAGKEACDYIVIYNNEENISRFSVDGWDFLSAQGRYLIYKVENVARIRNEYNSAHQLVMKKPYDAEGKPIQSVYGYYGVEYEYDQQGNIKKEIFLGKDYKKIELSKGYASIEYSYDHSTGRIESKRYLDKQDSPICYNGRYETRYGYDQKGYIIREEYYDMSGALMNHNTKGYAIRIMHRDQKGRVVSEYYYDAGGALAKTSMGYSSYEIIRDNEDKIKQEIFYDKEGEIIGHISCGMTAGDDLFSLHHSSDGVYESNGCYIFTTSIPNNQFNMIHFQLFSSDSMEYLLDFGNSNSQDVLSGEYCHELPNGLYLLRLKANSSLSDEYIDSYVYLKQGDTIIYRYNIKEFEKDSIVLMDVSVRIKESIET